MYFNHAYQKTLIATDIYGNTAAGFYTDNTAPGNKTTDIPAGTVAVVASLDTTSIGGPAANTVLNTAAAFGAVTLQQLPMVYLAQGSINTVDKLGPFAGGYKESVKTKGINPKYVTRFFVNEPTCPVAEVTNVCACGPDVQCGTSYYLRVDVKGSPALRFLTHNAYRTYASDNICCPTDPNASTAVDPMMVFTNWAWQILRDPIMNNFIAPELTWGGATTGTLSYEDAQAWWAANPLATPMDLYNYINIDEGNYSTTGDAYTPGTAVTTDMCIKLHGAYVDTQFGTCSFHPQDFYELAPVKIYASITDQQGDPCVDQIFCTTDAATLAVQGSGYGHRYLRDAILFRRYMQEQYVYDPRLREVMNQDQVYNWIVGTNFYTTYGILHSVPRFNNPTGVFDNDQYLITIVMKPSACSGNTRVTSFEDWMNAYLVKAGNGVQLEVVV
jgi:hypothetical protein